MADGGFALRSVLSVRDRTKDVLLLRMIGHQCWAGSQRPPPTEVVFKRRTPQWTALRW